MSGLASFLTKLRARVRDRIKAGNFFGKKTVKTDKKAN